MLTSSVTRILHWSSAVAMVLVLTGGTSAFGRGGPGGRGHTMGDSSHMADMQLIHELLDNGASVRRTVTMRPDGVETLTESDDPTVAKAIQAHVVSMYGRVTEGRPIHMRDPLFRAIFEHASQITFAHALTPSGIRVTETSTDPYVVRLIQAHAEVLNAFIRNGRGEAMKNHAVPPR
jgi:hypothetical protein